MCESMLSALPCKQVGRPSRWCSDSNIATTEAPQALRRTDNCFILNQNVSGIGRDWLHFALQQNSMQCNEADDLPRVCSVLSLQFQSANDPKHRCNHTPMLPRGTSCEAAEANPVSLAFVCAGAVGKLPPARCQHGVPKHGPAGGHAAVSNYF